MSRAIKVCHGTWPMIFGLERPAALAQAAAVIGTFGYDGVELAGFHGHATLDRFPDETSRRRLAADLGALGLEPVLLAPDPLDGTVPRGGAWVLSGRAEALAAERHGWLEYLRFAQTLGVERMRVDSGTPGPLPYRTDYDAVWDRTVELFRWLGDQGAEHGCLMVWEMESGQPFNKPSEIVRLLDDVDHPNLQILYDTAHFHAATVVGHNQVQPREPWEGGQLELVRRLKGRIGHVHLCDTDDDVPRNWFASKLGFGKGSIDFDELLPALADCYDGEWWGVDAIAMGSEVWADCWDGAAFVREAVARHLPAVHA